MPTRSLAALLAAARFPGSDAPFKCKAGTGVRRKDAERVVAW